MQEKILQTASQLFLNHGFKSITMDDIAHTMGISKKTIYEYYKNKTELVEATTRFVFEMITQKIDAICCEDCEQSPIEALFMINDFMLENLKEDNAPEYQLQKYYPKIYQSCRERKFIAMTDGISENLERGIAQGLYREDLDIPVVARFYFSAISAIKSSEVFPTEMYKISELIQKYLRYHIRAIATQKGLKELDNYLKRNTK